MGNCSNTVMKIRQTDKKLTLKNSLQIQEALYQGLSKTRKPDGKFAISKQFEDIVNLAKLKRLNVPNTYQMRKKRKLPQESI